MQVHGKPYRTIWLAADGNTVEIIDQTRLPHEFRTVALADLATAAISIKDMWVRGAPLIGATAAYGMALHMNSDSSDTGLDEAYATLIKTRPTAINLRWALDRVKSQLRSLPADKRREAAYAFAAEIADEDVEINKAIGQNGLAILRKLSKAKQGKRLNILTHCNAGWLATVDWGTATAPIYAAQAAGLDIHVWVDETRPRNQGAHLTAWELAGAGVPHTLIVDNAGGHLMQHGEVDAVIVGTDRVTAQGDVCNKIGTYLKALAAHDNKVPFYVALPSPTIDWTVDDGVAEIPIEERPESEISDVWGRLPNGEVSRVRINPDLTPCANPAFDVTPARLVTALVTEKGVCKASAAALRKMFQR